MENITIEQAAYTQALKDNRVDCTCDEATKETDIVQARGHYQHCMLYQIARAIEIGQKFERESIRVSVDLWQYWHNRFPDKDRLRDATYKKYGYKVLSINYTDLEKEESLKKKIQEFESDEMETNKIFAGVIPESERGVV